MRPDALSVVIPAAGLGSRFLPLTHVMPKELLPLGEWPLIHHALLEVERAGMHEVVIVISPRKRAIRAYFEGDPQLERLLQQRRERQALRRLRAARALAGRLSLRFVEKETRGPGEAVLVAQRVTGDDVMGVLLPDDVIPSAGPWDALRATYTQTEMSTLCVRPLPRSDISRFGVADCRRQRGHLRVHRLVEKPDHDGAPTTHRIFGRYVVTAAMLETMESRYTGKEHELQLTDGFAACLGEPPGVFAVEFTGDFYDCGTPDEYARSVARYALTHEVDAVKAVTGHAAKPRIAVLK